VRHLTVSATIVAGLLVASTADAGPYFRFDLGLAGLYAHDVQSDAFTSVRGIGYSVTLAGGYSINRKLALFAELSHTSVSGKMTGEENALNGDLDVRTLVLGAGLGVAYYFQPRTYGFASALVTACAFEQNTYDSPTTLTSYGNPFVTVGVARNGASSGFGVYGKLLLGLMHETGYTEYTAPTLAFILGANVSIH